MRAGDRQYAFIEERPIRTQRFIMDSVLEAEDGFVGQAGAQVMHAQHGIESGAIRVLAAAREQVLIEGNGVAPDGDLLP